MISFMRWRTSFGRIGCLLANKRPRVSTAIDADSKLIVSYLVGLRNSECAEAFITDLAQRLAQRIQLSTDGLKIYIDAVENAFGADVDDSQLVKQYAAVV